MIHYIKGNIFHSSSDIIVNTINTDGVMGKGIALEFKKRYPEMFDGYVKLCHEKKIDIGNLILSMQSSRKILLFPTKKHWRNKSKLEYIELGLNKFVKNWDKFDANSIAFPKLGCGNGGLNWKDVKPLMEQYLGLLPLEIFVYVDFHNDTNRTKKKLSEIETWKLGQELSKYKQFRELLKIEIHKSPNVNILEQTYTFTEKKDEIYINGEIISKELLCDFWYFIKDSKIIKPCMIPSNFKDLSDPILYYMYQLGYLEKIIVSENGIDFSDKPNAYQYIEN